MTLLTLALVLFLIMDPVGRINAFLNTLGGIEHKRQKIIIIRELLIGLAVMIFFSFVGDHIFSILEISNVTVFLTSGIILFLGSIKILFPSADEIEAQKLEYSKKNREEPFLVPLAIPMIAGPALLATIMLYSGSEESISTMLSAIVLAWVAAAIILIYSKSLLRLLGSSGLAACEKLMGMVLVLLSVQRFMEGVILLCKNYNA
ncbi:MAG: antibiotic transporter [Verrucomicrobia bacterium]|nr:antibiotic transporter [Verrucomicrobiota bacterium]